MTFPTISPHKKSLTPKNFHLRTFVVKVSGWVGGVGLPRGWVGDQANAWILRAYDVTTLLFWVNGPLNEGDYPDDMRIMICCH